jgi:hypothetical protein
MPAAKRVRITCSVDGPVKKRLDRQCEERGYSLANLMEKAMVEYLAKLERLPTLDEQILAITEPPLGGD